MERHTSCPAFGTAEPQHQHPRPYLSLPALSGYSDLSAANLRDDITAANLPARYQRGGMSRIRRVTKKQRKPPHASATLCLVAPFQL
jgi:hypothetical protein